MQRKSPEGGTSRRSEAPEANENRKKQRRAAYATDPVRSGDAREAARERYNRTKEPNATAPRLPNGLFTRGEDREVTCEGLEEPVVRETFTIPEAAAALGRSEATLRRWITGDKLPPPYLRDLGRDYQVYSVGELEVVARYLMQHEHDFTYLVSQHTHVVEMLQQAISAYRAEFV